MTVPAGTKFNWRAPSLWDNFQQWGSGVDHSAIVASEVAAAKDKLDFWLYGFYPPSSVYVANETPIMQPFEAHAALSNRTDVKFAFRVAYTQMMQPSCSGANFTGFANYINTQTENSAYFRVDGKPLIALYNDTACSGGWASNSSQWTSLKNTIGEPVYALSTTSQSMATTLGLQGVYTYGPNGSLVAGTGRKTFASQHSLDLSHDGASGGLNRISSRTAFSDRRPFIAEGSTSWIDKPTQPEWYSAIQSAIPNSQKLFIIYSWNEVAEGNNGIVPSVQDGARFLDAIGWIKTGVPSTPYTFKWSANWLSCGTSGAWTENFPDPNGVQGAHDGDQMISSGTGAYRDITLNSLSSCDIYAEKGPAVGELECMKDGVVDQTIDLYAASPTVSFKACTVTFSGAGPHTCRGRVKGTKNASSSSVQIKLDYFGVTYNPSQG